MIQQGYFQSVASSVRIVVSALAMAGHDEAAATPYGYTSSFTPAAFRDWQPAQEGDAVSALLERLGAARYDELTRQGAHLDADAVLGFARTAVTACSRTRGGPNGALVSRVRASPSRPAREPQPMSVSTT